MPTRTQHDHPDDCETDLRDEAARQWLFRRFPASSVVGELSAVGIRQNVERLYPGKTPGQDGWSSFCEDYAADAMALAQDQRTGEIPRAVRSTDPLDAATGEGRR